jgi:hypothetical protein
MLHRLDRVLARRQAQGLSLTGIDLCHPDMIGAPQDKPRRRAVFSPDPPINWSLVGASIARATVSTGLKLNRG